MATVKSLDERLDDLTKDLASFKAKIETIVALQRWLGIFGAGVIVTLIFNGFTVANSAGKLEATVVQLQGNIKTLEEAIKKYESTNRDRDRQIEQMSNEVRFLNERIFTLTRTIEKPRGE